MPVLGWLKIHTQIRSRQSRQRALPTVVRWIEMPFWRLLFLDPPWAYRRVLAVESVLLVELGHDVGIALGRRCRRRTRPGRSTSRRQSAPARSQYSSRTGLTAATGAPRGRSAQGRASRSFSVSSRGPRFQNRPPFSSLGQRDRDGRVPWNLRPFKELSPGWRCFGGASLVFVKGHAACTIASWCFRAAAW